MRRRALTLLAAVVSALACAAWPAEPARAQEHEVFDAATLGFLRKVEGEKLSRVVIQYKGRLGILETLALDYMGEVTGSRSLADLAPAVEFFEIYVNSGLYLDRPLLYVRQATMRGYLEKQFEGPARQQFLQTRRIPPLSLMDQEAARALLLAGRATQEDIERASKGASLSDAMARLQTRREMRVPIEHLSERYSEFLGREVLRLVPTPKDWHVYEMLPHLLEHSDPAAQTQPALQAAASAVELVRAWKARDAAAVNAAVDRLQTLVRQAVGPQYPSPAMIRLERIYNATYQATVIWIGFALSLVLLIAAAGGAGAWARWSGMSVFILSTAALLGGFILRWVLSGKPWYLPPMMNQFESVISSALLGALLAVGLEIFLKQNFYALAAAFYATVSLLCGFFLPQAMDATVSGATRGILVSPIMAIHVATIIIGHALVGMTLVISLAYLLAAAITGLDATSSSSPDLTRRGTPSTLAAIDRCNLIVAQLACWMVIVGTLLGAYWADFAWARWWGWDPKEVWALITALIYVAVLHVRFAAPAQTRGLWTACLCVLGCAVMLFNWIIVNFFLKGLHSYA